MLQLIKQKEEGMMLKLFILLILVLYIQPLIQLSKMEKFYIFSKQLRGKYLKEDNGFIIIHGHSHSAEGFLILRIN